MQKQNPQFYAAVRQSKNLYDLTIPFQTEVDSSDDPVLRALVEGVEHNHFAQDVISIFNRIFWRRLQAEETAPGVPTCEEALMELRQQLYRLIHDPSVTIKEYGRNQEKPMDCVEVKSTLVFPY